VQFDEHKRNRADLAGFFVKNAIPTESNFSELIASGLNQRDDGIAKPADGPVSLQGTDRRGLRRVLDLFNDFSDDMPSWTLSVQGAPRNGLGIGSGSDDSIRLFIDAASGNVGINTSTPGTTLDVNGDLNVSGTIFGSTGVRPSAGEDGGVRFPDDAFGGGGDRAYIRWVTRGGEATTLEIGNENDPDDHIALNGSGNVGIGTRAPSYKLDVQGAIAAGTSDIYFTHTAHEHVGRGNVDGHAAIENASNFGCLMILGREVSARRKVGLWDDVNVNGTLTVNGSAVQTSDARLKEHVEDAPYGLDVVNQLRPVVFEWRDQPNPHRSIGLIAQEVREVLGDVVHGDESAGESLGVAYTSLIPVLINAVQELDRRVAGIGARDLP
jgi:hypothetical protein